MSARVFYTGSKVLSVLLAPVLPALTSRVAQEFFGLDRNFPVAELLRTCRGDIETVRASDPGARRRSQQLDRTLRHPTRKLPS